MNDIKDGSCYGWNDLIDAMEEYRNKAYQPFTTTNSSHHHHHHGGGGGGANNNTETQWRDATWSTAATATSVQQQQQNANASEHAVSQPIMLPRRRGSFPGSDGPSMLSPRLSDTGVKMVEYVLSNSPTNKDIETRMARLTVSGSGEADKKGILENENSKLSHKDDHHHHHSHHATHHPHHSHTGHRGEHAGTANTAGQNANQNLQNGIMHNGLDDDGGKGFNRTPGSHQAATGDEEGLKNAMIGVEKGVKNSIESITPCVGMMLDGTHAFDPNFDSHMGMDPLQFGDYSHILPSAIDSPGMLEYNTQIYQQRAIGQNQHTQSAQAAVAAALNQQQPYSQVAAAAQQPSQGLPHPYSSQGLAPQSGAGGNPFPQNPYYQDPFAAQTGHLIPAGPPPTIMPPYFGLSWNMYPNMIQGGQNQHFAAAPHVQQQQTQQQQTPSQQQQQMIAQNNGQRPLTPQSANDPNNASSQFSMLPAHGYYDQNGSLLMGNSAAVTSTNMRAVNPAAAAAAMRGMNPGPMRILPPMLVNPNQAGNNVRLIPGSGQNGQAVPPSMLSSNASNVNSNTLYTSGSNASALGYPNSAVSSSTLMNGNLGFNPISSAQGGFSNGVLGPIGASSNMSNGSPRRESFDTRRPDNSLSGGIFSNNHIDGQFTRHFNNKNGQFYGPISNAIPPSPGPVGMIPQNQSLTPPPTMNGTNGINPSAFNAARVMPAAPASDGKYMVLNVPINGNILPSNFQNRVMQRNSSIDKSAGRSRFLEEFRNNRYPNLTLRELVDHIVEFSQDQHGSRFIQQKLERATTFEKQLVFNEILPAAYNLMTDVFGNYVIQKFFEFGTPEQKQQLAMKVKGHVLQLALQMYGCRVIQKALESIPPEQQKEIVKELDGHVLKCVKDQNGNHVVQKCIECVDPHALQFIIKDFQGQVYTLSTHPYGCRVIQRILEHCTPEQTTPILEELHSHTEQLVQDQYGNYVIQHVLEHGRPEDKSKIINSVRGKMLSLSQHKFASNVIEKCVTHASRSERALLIEEVCSYQENGASNDLYRMMKDQYANYVVQKMIEVAEPIQKKLLLQRIRPLLHVLRKYTYGKHILAKLDKYMGGKGGEISQSQQIGNTANGSI